MAPTGNTGKRGCTRTAAAPDAPGGSPPLVGFTPVFAEGAETVLLCTANGVVLACRLGLLSEIVVAGLVRRLAAVAAM